MKDEILAKDLRIGNIIGFINKEDEPHIPIYNFPKVIFEITNEGVINYNFGDDPWWLISMDVLFIYDATGIPMTDEWAIKFGFTERYNNLFILNIDDHHDIIYDSTNDDIMLECDDGFYSINISHIKFIHQIQNLYFSLTGKELTLN